MDLLLTYLKKFFARIDWLLFASAILLSFAGMATMNSFSGDSYFFQRQVWVLIFSVFVFFVLSFFDFRFLRKTGVVVGIFLGILSLLFLLFAVGTISKGAQSWFRLGSLSLQPAEFAKLALIILLSKYFSRRHIEIANIRHILVSGLYAFILFIFVALQPDFGSAVIIFCIWLGMVLVSGLSKKHLLAVVAVGVIAFAILWVGVFQPYQKHRIVNFINPLADIRGTGYNAYQAMIAVGSGQIMGKGIGYGTQSKLQFLPEYQTDFIFAAFAEEWGFVGVIVFFIILSVLIFRILSNSIHGATNFEVLFGLGLAIYFIAHILINIGMNIGIMPVTGVTVPFMSYGGSHMLTEFIGLGILMGMRGYRRMAHKDSIKNEIVGI